MSADGAGMAETTNRSKESIMAETKATLVTPFVGPDGEPLKVTKEERDNLKLLGVDFGKAETDDTTTEKKGAK